MITFILIALNRTFKISTDIVANSGVLYNGGGGVEHLL